MALDIKGKVALVTGGGSGLCLGFTKKLLDGGCSVVVADLKLVPEAEEVMKSGGGADGASKVEFVKTDVTDWNQLQHAFDVAMEKFGRLDIVIPGAGIFEPASPSSRSSHQCVHTEGDWYAHMLTIDETAAILQLLAFQRRRRQQRHVQLQDD
jgi:NAD(P)-dependent dehydrogenase (short-subunit alcohol dehydrogenase family)